MAEAEIDTHLKPWGNSLGIIIPAQVAKLLHAQAGASVHVTIRYEPGRNDPDSLPAWNWGGQYDIDKILDEEE